MLVDIDSIMKVCGLGSYLQIGCARQTLVHDLLKRSVDAYGIDNNSELITQLASTAPGRFIEGSVTNYPFQRKTFDTVIVGTELLNFSDTQLPLVLKMLQESTKHHLVIYFPAEVLASLPANSIAANRLFWEKVLIAAGFRKHTRSMLAIPYQDLENESMGRLLFFETIPTAAQEEFSLAWLAENRDLHMDMLREAGRRSDGHVSRYVLAANHIRPGDIVLDAACGLGYGTAVMAACSPGAHFIGVDIDPTSVSYATANYAAENPNLSYRESDVTKLSFLADHSIDTIISFETIEHVPDYELLLAEFRRVLKPDGRFLGSVPNLWCDETGNDPNPYHFHVFDWKKFNNAINQYFIVDGRWAQTAGGGFRLQQGQRQMQYIPLAQQYNQDCEWWIISACGNPFNAKNIAYTNPFQKHENQTIPQVIDFGKYYDNPWIYRVIVQLGERIIDRDVLRDACLIAEKDSRVGSADQGAALCVLCYQLLEIGHANLEYFSALADRINLFEQAYDKTNPHAYRWAISLNYIAARLLLQVGNRDEALKVFINCAQMDPLFFSPLLATKTISARYYAGLILAGNGKMDEAKEQFLLGIKESERVMQSHWNNVIGTANNPLSFGLTEASEVLEIASMCSNAMLAIERQAFIPGYFWNRANAKRFGLLEWNKDLERENESLRNQLVKPKSNALFTY